MQHVVCKGTGLGALFPHTPASGRLVQRSSGCRQRPFACISVAIHKTMGSAWMPVRPLIYDYIIVPSHRRVDAPRTVMTSRLSHEVKTDSLHEIRIVSFSKTCSHGWGYRSDWNLTTTIYECQSVWVLQGELSAYSKDLRKNFLIFPFNQSCYNKEVNETRIWSKESTLMSYESIGFVEPKFAAATTLKSRQASNNNLLTSARLFEVSEWPCQHQYYQLGVLPKYVWLMFGAF